jgi:hypothetical protein
MSDSTTRYSGVAKLLVAKRLGPDWQPLAEALDIPLHQRANFRPGDEGRGIWDWLETRGLLDQLPRALVQVDRADLTDILRLDERMSGSRSGPTLPRIALLTFATSPTQLTEAISEHLRGQAVVDNVFADSDADLSGGSGPDEEIDLVAVVADDAAKLGWTFFWLGMLSHQLGAGRVALVEGADVSLPRPPPSIPVIRLRHGDAAGAAAGSLYEMAERNRLSRRGTGSDPSRPSVFISYAWADGEFVEKLSKDLTAAGYRVWLDRNEIRTGQPIAVEIERGVASSDRLMVVLSRDAVRSEWVQNELGAALQRGTPVYPLRLDDSVLHGSPPLVTDLINWTAVADFVNWRDPGAYERALRRLVRDLAFDAAAGGIG